MHTKIEENISAMEAYGREVIAPILVDYVEWVLEKAQAQGLHRLYFLARDGHILQKLATLLCRQSGFRFQCRYLFAHALPPVPAYHILSEEDILAMVGENACAVYPVAVRAFYLHRSKWILL